MRNICKNLIWIFAVFFILVLLVEIRLNFVDVSFKPNNANAQVCAQMPLVTCDWDGPPRWVTYGYDRDAYLTVGAWFTCDGETMVSIMYQ